MGFSVLNHVSCMFMYLLHVLVIWKLN